MTMLDCANRSLRRATAFRGPSPAATRPAPGCVLRLVALAASPGPPGEDDSGCGPAPRRGLCGRYARPAALQPLFRMR